MTAPRRVGSVVPEHLVPENLVAYEHVVRASGRASWHRFLMDGWERSHSMGGTLAGLIAEARPELRHVAIG